MMMDIFLFLAGFCSGLITMWFFDLYVIGWLDKRGVISWEK